MSCEGRFIKLDGDWFEVTRAALAETGPALQKERWSGTVDSVGSTTLANVLAQTAYGGAVAACGLAGGMDLPATVAPHILRAVALLGVDSVFAPVDQARLARIARTEPLSALPALADDIVAGRIRGRVVIDIAG